MENSESAHWHEKSLCWKQIRSHICKPCLRLCVRVGGEGRKERAFVCTRVHKIKCVHRSENGKSEEWKESSGDREEVSYEDLKIDLSALQNSKPLMHARTCNGVSNIWTQTPQKVESVHLWQQFAKMTSCSNESLKRQLIHINQNWKSGSGFPFY